MIADGSRKFSRLERHALRTTQILVRAAIALQIRTFQSASGASQRVMATALAMIGLFARALGLLLQAGEGLKYVLAARKPTDWKPGAFEGRVAAFVNPSNATRSRMIPKDV